MRCPVCGCLEDKVIDSRSVRDDSAVRRRRECLQCAHRFTTYESIISDTLKVVKRNGVREPFERDKIRGGIVNACYKRPVTDEQLERAADEIEAEMQNSLKSEYPSRELGGLVMDKLRELDEVAYVRFASVYRQFRDINTFMAELTKLLEEK